MGFWSSILGDAASQQELCAFGRFSDAYKSKAQYEIWDAALQKFEHGDYLDSIKHLLDYLRNQNDNNLKIIQESPSLVFELYQGSKVLRGEVNERLFRAEVVIADCLALHIGFLRKSVEKSFDLIYGRYALNDKNQLCLIFDSLLPEASPHKLYYGMKEIAVHADKDDDLLLDEYPDLKAINNQHIKNLKSEWLTTKVNFVRRTVENALKDDALGSLKQAKFPGAMSYIYLSALYKIDYLAKPEGRLMDLITKAHKQYFSMVGADISQRVQMLRQGMEEIAAVPDEDLRKELYEVISTFGITNTVKHETIQAIIDNEMTSMEWYEENKHFLVCEAICDYLVGYCLYNFAMPEPVQNLFHLYMQLAEPAYFKSLEYPIPYVDDAGHIKLKEVKKRVEAIIGESQEKYPDLEFILPQDYSSRFAFCKAYLLAVRNLKI